MSTEMVITFTGPDRVGIVEEVTAVLLELGGNVGTSRMARLGGEFAVLALVSLPETGTGAVESAFAQLASQGYRISASPASVSEGFQARSGTTHRVEVVGADHEGIVHEIAHGLSELGINIESMETSVTEAPVSGAPLFTMNAVVFVPSSLQESVWIASLGEAADHANVDIVVSAADRT